MYEKINNFFMFIVFHGLLFFCILSGIIGCSTIEGNRAVESAERISELSDESRAEVERLSNIIASLRAELAERDEREKQLAEANQRIEEEFRRILERTQFITNTALTDNEVIARIVREELSRSYKIIECLVSIKALEQDNNTDIRNCYINDNYIDNSN